MTDAHIQDFIDRWRSSGASEKANFQSFINELCDLLEVPRPDAATGIRENDGYAFERPVTFAEGATGFIDLYKRGCFVMEGKQGADAPEATPAEALGGAKVQRRTGTAKRGTRSWDRAMEAARNQAERYARAIDDEWPPFLLIVDVGFCIDVFADFARMGKGYARFPTATDYRIGLDDLLRPEIRERLRHLFTAPLDLDPERRTAPVTRKLAERLALLARSLEAAGHHADTVANYLVRCLFTMFAEDVGLIRERSFTELLEKHRDRLDAIPKLTTELWQAMDKGGFSAGIADDVRRFNGRLFHDAKALELDEAGLDLLIQAAQADWTHVEPAIFGTLLERALSPKERHRLGAHYTPRAYVERLVRPTIIEPLTDEWKAVQAAAARFDEQGKVPDAVAAINAFHQRLCTITVLDPACGSGNFLYVTLDLLKRLEREVLDALEGFGQSTLELSEGNRVSPTQLRGLEINPRAAAVAEVVLWIGYLQWHFRTYGDANRLDEPLLKDRQLIERRDAVLAHGFPTQRLDADGNPVTRWDGTMKPSPVTGEQIPDETARTPVFDYPDARPAEWPEATFIVGNPPFVGSFRMREALGDGYAEALRNAYPNVPESADFVMYWWYVASGKVARGEAERFGLITTNSITQTFQRRVVEARLDAANPIHLAYAIPDHPWVDSTDGAAVRIGMTVGAKGDGVGRLAAVAEEERTSEIARIVQLEERAGVIHPDLTTGADLTDAVPLLANAEISCPGVKLHGSGFIVAEEKADELGLSTARGLDRHIRPYRNGRDLTQTSRNVMVIDLLGLEAEEVRQRFPEVYQHVLENVKPERDQNRRASYRDNWWIHGEPRKNFRPALKGLSRYISTVETSKHRFFVFLDKEILPDNMLVNIASEDAFHLGVLSSRIHVTWALAAGGSLEDRPRYNKGVCFEPFPFPYATEKLKQTIRKLAEELDAHRKKQQATHNELALTNMYNVLEKLAPDRARGKLGEALSAKEKTVYEQGLVGVLKDLHDRLDAAVAEAYGWPAKLNDQEILARLVALNAERAAEEAQGHIRWLRPEYQSPEAEGTQTSLAVEKPKVKKSERAATPWPDGLPAQMQAVQRLLGEAASPLDAEAAAQIFEGRASKKRREAIAEILETLVGLGLARRTEAGAYAV